jgi:hypothetical protein
MIFGVTGGRWPEVCIKPRTIQAVARHASRAFYLDFLSRERRPRA